MKIGRKQSVCAFAAALIVAGVTAADAAWVVTEVPQQLGWSGDTALYGINDNGVACGVGNYVSEVSSVAIITDGTAVTELPYLHPAPSTYPFAWASAISSNGLVAGRSHSAKGVDRAVIWDGPAITLIPHPADANTNNDMRAYGLNGAGVAVGYYSSTTTGQPAAFYYDGTTHSLVAALQAIGLGLNGMQSYADDVNSSGLICGEARDISGEYNFFTYDITSGTATNLGRSFNWDGSHAAAINDAGDVIGRGRSDFTSPIHALLHDGAFNIIDDTITPSQWALDITNAGRVVGRAGTMSTGGEWAWYSDGPGSGSMIRVDLPGWDRLAFRGVSAGNVMTGSGRTVASPDDDRGCIVSPPPGDENHNGAVDLDDHAQFVACISGPKEAPGFVAPSQACLEAFDLTPSAESYTVEEIPFLPGWNGDAEAIDINSSGVVCGNGNYVSNTSSTPFRYNGLTVTELDILPDADVPIAIARAINASGVVCGDSHEADADSRAVYWENTTVNALPYPADMDTTSDFRAYDISDTNVIVGYYYNTNGVGNRKTAFYYDGAMHSLGDTIRNAGLTGGYQAASGIDNGIISGSADDAFGTQNAWTYDIGADILTVIGTITPFKNCSAVDINESGQTIGRSQNASSRYRATTYDGTWHFVDDSLDRTQYGMGINDGGRMVGYNYLGGGIYEGWYSNGPGDGSIVLLDAPGWASVLPRSINNGNVIVGYGETSGGDDRGCIFTPVSGDGDIDLDDFAVFQQIFEGS
ncbi:MAG: DUF3466 family protein [bacterium]|nr:DUF3466 family protein [bacterium]